MPFLRKLRQRLSKFVWLPLSIVPLAGEKLEHIPLFWPPIGSIETYLAALSAGVIALIGMLPRFFATKASAKRWAAFSTAFAFAVMIVYGIFLISSVQGVDTPKDGRQYRVIGSERTPLAQKLFPEASDEEILRKAGLTDEAIEQMWTRVSVARARIELFLSYLCALACANFAIGSANRALPEERS